MFVNNFRISLKLPAIIVVIAFVSSFMTGWVSLKDSFEKSYKATEEKLSAINSSRKASVINYFESVRQDLSFLSNNPYVRSALIDFKSGWNDLGGNQTQTLQKLYIETNPNIVGKKDELDFANDGSLYSAFHKEHHGWFRHFLKQRSYYDIFLFDTEGNLVYTVYKELDYATNLNNGKYKDSDLGKAYRAAINPENASKQHFFDFKAYAPSHGAAASFMSQSILDDGGNIIGALVFQTSISRINSAMQVSDGMGNIINSFLVGEDFLMRSDSLTTEHDDLLNTKVETDSVKLALNGEKGSVVLSGENESEIMSSYDSFDFMGTKYAVIAELDNEQILSSIRDSQMSVVKVVSLGLLLVAIFAICIGRGIANPISGAVKVMKRLADGDSSVNIAATKRKDEIGDMISALQVFKENLDAKNMLEKEQQQNEKKAKEARKATMVELANKFEESVQLMINSVASSSTELMQSSEAMGGDVNNVNNKSRNVYESSQRTSANVAAVASASEEMSASVREISDQINKSTEVINEAVRKTEAAESSAKSLDNASQQIGSVLSLIHDIAEQINLLALNATIESARAGEAGKGFAVVASEVKNLSNQATKATGEISSQIENIQSISSEVFDVLREIKLTVDKVNEYSGGISAAVEEQTATTSEIAQNMVIASKGTNEVNNNISDISDIASNAKDSSVQMIDASRSLSQEAEQLSNAVSNFLQDVRNG